MKIVTRNRWRRTRTVAALVALTVAIAACGDESADLGSGATAPSTGPGSSVSDEPAVSWETDQVSFDAESVTIQIGDRTFHAVSDGVPPPGETGPFSVHSDPGFANYTTLEIIWIEQGVEMRLFIYFTSDGTDWWANEIRTYDGRPNGEWVTYLDEFFRSPLGTPFTGDFVVEGRAGGEDTKLEVPGLRLQVGFRAADACAGLSSSYTLALDMPIVLPLGAYYATGVSSLTDDRGCGMAQVDPSAAYFEWTLDDPTVATLIPQCPIGGQPTETPPNTEARDATCAQFALNIQSDAPGQTTLRVRLRAMATDAVLAEASVPLTVE